MGRKETNSKYYQANKEKIKSRKNVKINCSCGGKFTVTNLSTHLKSNKHENYVRLGY